MRALLDVNVLLALFDQHHVAHQRASQWLKAAAADGWASCPITQAGFVRIISGSSYGAGIKTAHAMEILASATADAHHEFWPADVDLTGTAVNRTHVLGPNQVTDAYLLALAVAHNGRLVTFDQRIALTAVPGARPEHLLVL